MFRIRGAELFLVKRRHSQITLIGVMPFLVFTTGTYSSKRHLATKTNQRHSTHEIKTFLHSQQSRSKGKFSSRTPAKLQMIDYHSMFEGSNMAAIAKLNSGNRKNCFPTYECRGNLRNNRYDVISSRNRKK